MSGTTANTGFQFPITATDGTVAYNNVLTPNTVPSSDGSGVLYACGYNGYGGLGNGTTINCSSPIQIGSLNTWKQISGSFYGIAAIKTDGTLWACGYNVYGTLGNGTTNYYSSPIQVGSLSNWSQVALNYHIAAIKTDGTLWTWGLNNYGQLGNGRIIWYSSPIQVGALTNWSQVASGSYGIAAIKTDGTLWTWGVNDYGQLGNGTIFYYSSPIQIGSLTNWKQISSGDRHTAAIKTDGTLWTWGFNSTSALGNGTTIHYSSPIQIGSLTNWSQVSCGYYFTAAIKTDGTLWACGYNGTGALGNGTTISYSSPIQVGLLTNWSQVAGCYRFTTAIKTDGTLWTWGRNDYGQLGNGTIVYYSSPIQIGSLTNWSKVAQGQAQTLNALANYYTVSKPTIVDMSDMFVPKDLFLNSGLWAWGSNDYGTLGNGTSIWYSSPVQVGALTNWKSISIVNGQGPDTSFGIKTDGTLWGWGSPSAYILPGGVGISSPIQIGTYTNWKQICGSKGGTSVAGLRTDGTLWAWGYNEYGQLGNSQSNPNSPYAYISSPIQIGALTNWKQVSMGQYHAAAVKTDGTLWAWGYNNNGQLGYDTTIYTFGTTNQSSPVQVAGGSTWANTDPNTQVLTISGWSEHAMAIASNGTLWAWGQNDKGQLGIGSTLVSSSGISSPTQVGALTNWKQVACGYTITAAIKTDGTLWTCGYGGQAALGNGSLSNSATLGQVGALTNWSQVACGAGHMAAVKTDGTLWTWGYNYYGELGNNTSSTNSTNWYSSPVQIGALTTWKQVACAAYMTFAVKTDGTLWSCGYNRGGTLGNSVSAFVNYSSPVQIGALTTWKQVSAGQYHAVAIKTDGTAWSWGVNTNGQLGLGDASTRSAPVQIGLLTTWKQAACGASSTALIKTDGTLWTCGYNTNGQLGNGTVTQYSSPIQVGALTNWSQVFSLQFGTYGYKTDNTLWDFGQNNKGQLGWGVVSLSSVSSPQQVGSLTNWKQVSAGIYATAAIKTDNTLWTWGYDAYGQLGNGTTINYSSPIQIGSLTNWKQIDICQHAAAVKTDGTLWTWGKNGSASIYGNLGNGTTINYSSPIQIGSLTNWKQVVASPGTTAAVKTDGTLWTWGRNDRGQLGFTALGYYSSPIQVGSLTIWKQVAGATYYTLGIQAPDLPIIAYPPGNPVITAVGASPITVTVTSTSMSPITSYTCTCVELNNTQTNSTGIFTFTGATAGNTYTFIGTATSSVGTSNPVTVKSVASFVVGQQAYTTPGTFSWTAPAGVTSVSVVAVGGGGAGSLGGSGGGLGWKNNITVVPGNIYTVVVGAGAPAMNGNGSANNGSNSYFISNTTVMGGGGIGSSTGGVLGGVYVGDGGGNGGGTRTSRWGGAGAGGYSGKGGNTAIGNNDINAWYGEAGSGGAGGGGSSGVSITGWLMGAGGGGVGILGQGTNGVAGANGTGGSIPVSGGGGGSGGANGTSVNDLYDPGGIYGGGGGAQGASGTTYCGAGGNGAVRIIWGDPSSRYFPSSNTTDM